MEAYIIDTAKDNQDLVRLEGIIQKNIGAFYEVGRALMEIRDRELYKIRNGGEYATFEAYCKGAWDFSSRNAYHLIDAAMVIENVNNCSQKQPCTESQARPLARLEPDQQREAWQRAVDTAPEGKVTAAHVYKIVKEMTVPEIPKTAPPEQKPQEPTDAMQFAMIAISQLERISLTQLPQFMLVFGND
jgi:hypothetical protein